MKKSIYIYYKVRYNNKARGDLGEGVNTSGCEPDMRQFESDRSPH